MKLLIKVFNPPVLLLLLLAAITKPAAAALPSPTELTREFVRTTNKDYPLTADGLVELTNRYGEIDIQPWTENRVSLRIRVVVQARSEEAANATFDRINITTSGSSTRVVAETSIGDGSSGGIMDRIVGWFDGSSSSNEFKIYYEVRMPRSANLKATARYCDVRSGDLGGAVEADVKYGDLRLGDVGGAATLSVAYGKIVAANLRRTGRVNSRYSNVSITSVGDLDLDLRYSEFKIGRAGNVTLDSRYDDGSFGVLNTLRVDAGYGDFKIDELQELTANSNYTEYNIGQLARILDVDTDYGDVTVSRLLKGFTSVKVQSSYSQIHIRMEDGSNYDLDVETSYADVETPSGFNPRVQIEKGSDHTVRGVMGKGGGRIVARLRYGDFTLER
ncbi:MAG: DUF4097 family beta strand repeat-containing protein [Saprospiraceae bacterium]